MSSLTPTTIHHVMTDTNIQHDVDDNEPDELEDLEEIVLTETNCLHVYLPDDSYIVDDGN